MLKKSHKNYGELPPKQNPELIPWHTLCVDLIGPYPFGKVDKKRDIDTYTELWCITMIDTATGSFEIAEIPTKQADFMANLLEFHWLTRYPWPREIRMDQGGEFKAKVQAALKDEYGITVKRITTRNPQSNSIIERIHQVVGDMNRVQNIRDKNNLDQGFGWTGVLSAVRQAVLSLVHTTTRATPTQLVFGHDALPNVSFQADWDYIKERKQHRILQNNKRENAKRIPHTYQLGDQVMLKEDPHHKLEGARFSGPYTVNQINDNCTVQLSKATILSQTSRVGPHP
jgi:hypothetical protein